MTKGAFFAVLAATTFCGVPAAGAPRSERNEAFERQIDAQLRARDASAADEFAEATAAFDRGDFDAAAEGFEHVRTEDPWFVHATRRLCSAEVERGNRNYGVALCRQAVWADRSPENEAALAFALVRPNGSRSEADVQEALQLARDASFKQEQTDPFTQLVLCQCALAEKDFATLAICADRLKSVAPHEMGTHYFATIAAATRGRVEDAERELEAAHAQGLPDGVYNELRQGIEDSRSPVERWGRIALRGFVAWLAGFALLSGGGALLSMATLRAVSRVPTEANGRVSGFDAGLRHTYRVVLWVTCAYYYASLPVVALLVVTMGAGVVYACVAMGQIPVKLVLIAAVLVLGSLWSIVKSLFVRARDEEPGEKLDLAENPKLGAVLYEVAKRIGTRPVDSVYLTHRPKSPCSSGEGCSSR
jgi:tetratricopeptide (TPR) repeat protein